jgi:CelD/BcsL family acetyltransferase involved in cellulose biosynthesis
MLSGALFESASRAERDPMLTAKAISTYPELLQLREEWQKLALGREADWIFASFEWVAAWWECFGNNRELLLLVVRDDGRLTAVAPLMGEKSRWAPFLRRYVFIGSHLVDHADIVAGCPAVESLGAVFGWLAEHKDSWDLVSFERILEGSRTLRELERVAKNPYLILPGDVYPSLRFDAQESAARLPGGGDTLRKIRAYFRKRGDLSFSTCNGNLSLAEKLLVQFFDMHRERWQNTATPSMFEDERCRRFFLSLGRAWIPTGKMEVYHLDLDGTPWPLASLFSAARSIWTTASHTTFVTQKALRAFT